LWKVSTRLRSFNKNLKISNKISQCMFDSYANSAYGHQLRLIVFVL
jgi:hypothetical protein